MSTRVRAGPLAAQRPAGGNATRQMSRDECLLKGDNRAARILCDIYRSGTVDERTPLEGTNVSERGASPLGAGPLAGRMGRRGGGYPYGTNVRCTNASCCGVAWLGGGKDQRARHSASCNTLVGEGQLSTTVRTDACRPLPHADA
jgi:hypothetical protein